MANLGVVERDGSLWIPTLSRDFVQRLARDGLDLKRRDVWPATLQEEYSRLRSQFTKAKAEFATWVRKDRDSRMTTTAKTITLALLECLNFETGRCDPSHQYLADEIGISRRQVERVVPLIAKAGWISITRRGCKETNSYCFRVASEKAAAILDYADHLREMRREERDRRNIRASSDPTSMTDQKQSDPTSMTVPDPTSMTVLDPTSMTDKPLNGTVEGEHLNSAVGYEGEGYLLRVREDSNAPFEAPASVEDSRKFLMRIGVPSNRLEMAMHRHMRETLLPSDVLLWTREGRNGQSA